MAQFRLMNKMFEFNRKVKQQVSGTAIGTKISLPYAFIYMDELKVTFLNTQVLQPLYGFHI